MVTGQIDTCINILRVAIDGLDIFQLSDVYQMNMYARS